MIEYISSLGYEITCNIMAISKYSDEQIVQALYSVAKTPALAVYVVDSYGALYPKQAIKLYHNVLSTVGKEVGKHAHNNQQSAFENTIEAKDMGARWLDGIAFGMEPRCRELPFRGSTCLSERKEVPCGAASEVGGRMDAADETGWCRMGI